MVNRRICFVNPYAIFHRHGNMKTQKTVREWCSRIWCNFSIFMNFIHFKAEWVYKCSCSTALKSGTQLAESYSDLAPTLIFLFFLRNNWAFKLLIGECLFLKFKKFFRLSLKHEDDIGQKSKKGIGIPKQGQSVLGVSCDTFCSKYHFRVQSGRI